MKNRTLFYRSFCFGLFIGLLAFMASLSFGTTSFAANQALVFDGNDDYADCGNGASLNLTGSMTIEAWIYPTGWGESLLGFGRIIDKGKYRLYLNEIAPLYNKNSLVFFILNDDSAKAFNTPENSICLNTWQHVAVTYDGDSEVRFYINGKEQLPLDQLYGSPVTGSIGDNSEYSLFIGENADNKRAFEGMIDEVRIWNTVRTLANIQTGLYSALNGDEEGLAGYWKMDEGTGDTLADSSPNGNNGIISGAIWSETLDYQELAKIPSNLQVTPGLTTTRLTWNAPISDETPSEYKIYRDDTLIKSQVTDTECTDEGVTPETTYCYTVTAVYNGVESAHSNEVCATPHEPVTIYVNTNATGSDNGTSWENAFTDLQSALTAALSDDQIWVAKGTYKPSETSNTDDSRFTTFQLKNGVSIYGGFAGTETNISERDNANVTTLSGDIGVEGDASDNAYHVVTNIKTDFMTILDGFTITQGNASGDGNDGSGNDMGGGIFNVATDIVLTNIIFTENNGNFGGGMANFNANPTLENITFLKNKAGLANKEGRGGGMYNEYSNPSLYNVLFEENSATNTGGGMDNQYSSPSLTRVDFIRNQAIIPDVVYIPGDDSTRTYGGGMSDYNSNPILNDVEFSENKAVYSGGGMYNQDNSSPLLNNVKFIQNSSDISGGGMGNNRYCNPVLTDVTFTGNMAMSDVLDPTDPDYATNIQDMSGGGMTNVDNSSPKLVNVLFENNTTFFAGGGMVNKESSPTLVNVRFVSNTASFGGGGLANSMMSSPSLTNVVFYANQALGITGSTEAGVGGGIGNQGYCSPVLTNVTFGGNTAALAGGAIANTMTSNLTMTNSILWGNTAGMPVANELYDDGSGTPAIASSIIQGMVDDDPLFTDSANGDLSLQIGSPAIDAGDNSAVPADILDIDEDGNTDETLPYDLASKPRIILGTVDLGAFEYPGDYELGDADGNGDVDIFDALLIAEYDAGMKTADQIPGFAYVDVDGNGNVDINDALLIAKYDVGLIDGFIPETIYIAEYWMLGEGDTWTYQQEYDDNFYTITETVSGTEIIDGTEAIKVQIDDENYDLFTATDGITLHKEHASGDIEMIYTPPLTLIPSEMNLGTLYTFYSTASGEIITGASFSNVYGETTLEGLKTVTVPAGTFTDCLQIKIKMTFEIMPQDSVRVYEQTLYLAKGVGTVKQINKITYDEQTITGIRELTSAEVSGVLYP